MKIGINIIGLFPGKNGGAEQYIRNIITTLNKNRSIDIYLFLNSEAFPTFLANETLHLYVITLGAGQDMELNQYISMLDLDVWFCPLFHLIPHNCPIPSVVAVFDIQQEYYPEYFDKHELALRKKETAYTMEHADLILTISEFSKKTIIEKYGLSPNQIQVTYLDADLCFEKALDQSLLKEIACKLPANYIFYPANSWPHKNHLRLIKAYKILRDKYGVSFKLVFTGEQKQEKKNIEKYINRNHLRDDIIYLGYVEQKKMPYIYACSDMVVFPSLFEGFGIPIVEAIKVGVPLACSEKASIPEIAGDAAIYFDAENPDDIAEKIYTLYTDSELRSKLISHGNQRKHMFSWEQCAAQTVHGLENLYKREKESQIKDKPLVSVITPSFNQGNFIRETINSVLNQGYQNIEYIVMDGGSTDQTINILKEYSTQIYWCSEKDEGQADAVNKGLQCAHGTIIGWLNSDDTYCENAIQCVVDFFNKHPKIDMVYGEGYYIDKEGKITGRYLTEPYSKDRLAETCIICQPAAFFRKAFVDRVGGLEKKLQLCMDYDLWMKMAKTGRIAYIPNYLACSRMYEENKTMSRRSEIYKEVCFSVKKHYGYVPYTWLNGYALYLCHGNRNFKFYLYFIYFFIRYNYDNLSYCKRFSKKVAKKLFGCSGKYVEMERYPDGWVSKTYHTNLVSKDFSKAMIISGEHMLPFSTRLKINIEIDGKTMGSLVLKKEGGFVKKVKFHNHVENGTHKVTLHMSEVMSPKSAGISNDNRQLSFILKEIFFVRS